MLQGAYQRRRYLAAACLVGCAVIVGLLVDRSIISKQPPQQRVYQPREPGLDTSGANGYIRGITPWGANASLGELADAWRNAPSRTLAIIDRAAASGGQDVVSVELARAGVYHSLGEAERAYQTLERVLLLIKGKETLEEDWLYTIIFYQGVTALRMGENDNCVDCLGESACILPIAPTAVHTHPAGSRLAIQHFREYLEQFPDDLEVRWLLNLAHMTLGQYPDHVEERFRLSLDRFCRSEFDVGRFRDISHRVGLRRFNMAGGAIMEDFDNDGLLDIVVTSSDPTEAMGFYRNKGDGTFEDRTRAAGLTEQRGGLYCVQADYNNDGHMDVFITRGAWLPAAYPMRPSLLRNNGDGTFTDVTREAGLLTALNAHGAAWADFDNDGFLDLFVCCEGQASRLYRNKGNGTFEEVAGPAGVQGNGMPCKGVAWIDFDNDGYPDLFLTYLNANARLFHNNRDGTFTDVTKKMGIDGPFHGFSSWAFDYDNDGWLDLFATSYDRTVDDVVKGLLDQPHERSTSKLYRNLGGKGFKDVTKEAGLDKVYSTMGSNFGDFDNDGYLDFYLGTGEPDLGALIPNRLFKNVAGKRFAEVTACSGTGHLQKGHGVAFGDWSRNGSVDLFIQMGGATQGDRYHNILFRNPGKHGNNWLNVKLVGKKTNRCAMGARIKVVTAGQQPLTIHRHVSSGSSFGANPLEQHIGLGRASRVARLEIYWPTSGTTQVFRDLAVNQGIEVTEFAKGYGIRAWKAIALPK